MRRNLPSSHVLHIFHVCTSHVFIPRMTTSSPPRVGALSREQMSQTGCQHRVVFRAVGAFLPLVVIHSDVMNEPKSAHPGVSVGAPKTPKTPNDGCNQHVNTTICATKASGAIRRHRRRHGASHRHSATYATHRHHVYRDRTKLLRREGGISAGEFLLNRVARASRVRSSRAERHGATKDDDDG